MAEKTPCGGLKWVRQEILANLERARQALADAADGSDAVAALFEVRSMLLALPLPAAATLAEEMQRAAEALPGADGAAAHRLRLALGQALALAPESFTAAVAGASEQPLALLPAINELRQARGLAPMSSAELLLPASVLAPVEALSREGLERLARIARKVRPHFHRYLVRWFGDQDPDAGLTGLARLFNQMRRYFKDGPVHELFLAAEGVVEGLLTGAILPDPSCKALIGRIDRVLKPLSVQPDPTWPEEVVSVLLSDLLAQLAQMPPSSPVLQELERVYGRRLSAANAPEPAGEDTSLLLETLRQELAPILALVAAAEVPAPADLEAAAGRLAQLGESFVLLGQEALGQRLGLAADALEQLATTPAPDAGRLTSIAHTLTQVDDELQALAELSRPPSVPGPPPMPRVRDRAAVVLREARAELARLRAELGPEPALSADPAGLPATLGVLARAIAGVGEREPARLLTQLSEQPGTCPALDATGLELLRRALAAVEIHLEDRLERDQADPRMLAEAADAIERLAALRRADQRSALGADSASQPASGLVPSANLEFLGLFQGEAAEQIEAIREQYARWRADPADVGALAALQRSLQALKASGGLVGAQQLAELARLTASLVEGALDQGAGHQPALAEFVAAVLAALPEAVQAEVEHRPPGLAALLDRGRALLAASGAAPPVAAAPWPAATPLTPTSSLVLPDSDALTVDPMTTVMAEEDFTFAKTPAASDGWRAPPAEGLLVETTDLNSSLREVFGAGSALEFGPSAVDTLDEVAFLDDADLGPVFVAEARELSLGLADWLREPPQEVFSESRLAAARRRLRSLKASALMAGLVPIAELSHALESLLAPAEGPAEFPPLPSLDGLQQAVNLLSTQVEAVAADRPIPVAAALIAALEAAPPVAAERREGGLGREPPLPTEETPALPPSARWPDPLIPLVSELGDCRARLRQQHLRFDLRRGHLEDAVRHLNRRLQGLAAGSGGEPPAPVQAGPMPAQVLVQARDLLAEVERVAASIGDLQREDLDLLQTQARLIGNLQERLLEGRLVPFGCVEARLQGLVSQTAASLGREVALTVEGAQVELDRPVLERFLVPLEHLLRNAVVHGIEPPALRRQRDKPAGGAVRIRLERAGEDILLQIADDGAGMDPERIRAHALARGLIAPDAQIEWAELLALTMRPGFSSADTVTQLAGRGVGLDLVKAEIAKLNGELAVSSTPGQGTAFHVRLPRALSLVDALLINAGGHLFAVPTASLVAVGRVARERLELDTLQVSVRYQDETFPVVSLAATLRRCTPGAVCDQPLTLPRRRWLPVLLVRASGQRMAFQIDALAGSQRLQVKPLTGSQTGVQTGPLSGLRWLLGRALLADGRVAPLLDLPALVRVRLAAPGALPAQPRRLLVVGPDGAGRQGLQPLLDRPELRVLWTADPSAAQTLLRWEPPDLVLLTTTLGANGAAEALALVRRLRTDADLRWLPVILLTDDEDPEHRRRALAAGVDRLLTLPVDDQALGCVLAALLASDEVRWP